MLEVIDINIAGDIKYIVITIFYYTADDRNTLLITKKYTNKV